MGAFSLVEEANMFGEPSKIQQKVFRMDEYILLRRWNITAIFSIAIFIVIVRQPFYSFYQTRIDSARH